MKYLVYEALSPSGKRYVGYTCQTLKRRASRHTFNARKGIRTRFSSALRKYQDRISWKIIQANLTKTEATALECKLISDGRLNDPEFGYNMTLGGDGGVTATGEREEIRRQKLRKFYETEEMRQVQSQKVKAFSDRPENRLASSISRGGREFICIETGEKFINVADTARKFGSWSQNLRDHLKGRRKSFVGFHFEYVNKNNEQI